MNESIPSPPPVILDIRGPLARSQALQRVLYSLLFVLLFGSAVLGAAVIVNGHVHVFVVFALVYLVMLLADSWIVYGLVAFGEMRRRRDPVQTGEERIAVLVPVFNEEPELLRRALDSVIAADGNKQVVLIDDGSDGPTPAILDEYAERHDLILHRLPQNAGKRRALQVAVENLPPGIDFVVTIDSDTVLDPEALVQIVAPLRSARVGASTGDVRLLNERRNAVTRMVGAYYWIGLNVYKQAYSTVGSVSCCSGCIAAYRASILRGVIGEFARQEFLGRRCTHSEDRHLTNLVLRQGFEVVYVPEAVSHTLTPHTVRGFVRQQLRWKRGYVRESLYTLTYAWRNRRFLFCQILFWDLTSPFTTLAFRISVVGVLVADPSLFVRTILPSWVTVIMVRYGVIVALRAPRKLPGMFVYVIFYEFVLYAVHLWALCTVRDSRWMTRGRVTSSAPLVAEGASVI